MALLLGIALALDLVQPALGVPTVTFPFNSQLPPAARVGELYSYAFAQYTFRSDSNLTYTLGDHPSWVSIESDQRRLYGTPEDKDVSSGDVVGQLVEVIATDDTGSTSMNATLVVSRNEAPEVQIPVSEQIPNFGHYSAPSSILSYPSTDFSYSFSPDTFTNGKDQLNYYAVSANSSPLPAWMKFDASTLTFSGYTPSFESLIQPPETFGFKLVASDIEGFSAASVSFSIIVGSHKLSTDKPSITLNATRGSKFTYDGLQDSIKLDQKPVDANKLEVTTNNLPDWVNLDHKTLKISGTPGQDAHSTNFTILFHDSFSDTLRVMAMVNVATGLFASTFRDIDAKPGEKLNIDLAPHLRNPDDIKISVDTDSETDWLTLDGFELNGTVPESAAGSVSIAITAQSKSSDVKEKEKLHINFVDTIATKTSTPSATSSASSTSKSAKPSKTGDKADKDKSKDSGSSGLSTSDILLATILPILLVVLIIMLVVCFLRRRRGRKTYLASKYRSKISNPIFTTLRVNGSDDTLASEQSIRHTEKAAAAGTTTTRMYKAPKDGYTDLTSHTSRPTSGSGSSGTTDVLSTPDLPAGFHAEGIRPNTGKSAAATEEGRRSWVTVDGTMTLNQSEKRRSHDSDVTLPDSMHQILPTPDFLTEFGDRSFREGLEWTLGSLDDYSSMQPPMAAAAVVARQTNPSLRKKRSTDMDSMVTTSSEALPLSRRGSRRYKSTMLARDQEPLLEEETENVTEIQRPAQARLSSQQWLSRNDTQEWYSTESSQESKSFRTETSTVSFGSSENWRAIGPNAGNRNSTMLRGPAAPPVPPPPPSDSYRELVNGAPFHPSRASTTVSLARDSGEELMSPSRWGDGDQKGKQRGRMRAETISEEGNGSIRLVGSGAFSQVSSSKGSEGSFKVFL